METASHLNCLKPKPSIEVASTQIERVTTPTNSSLLNNTTKIKYDKKAESEFLLTTLHLPDLLASVFCTWPLEN